jgi:hypothetical protein
MNALENMDRKKLTLAGLIVAAIFLFFINIGHHSKFKLRS